MGPKRITFNPLSLTDGDFAPNSAPAVTIVLPKTEMRQAVASTAVVSKGTAPTAIGHQRRASAARKSCARCYSLPELCAGV
jgi:hypothetical protein